MKNPSQISPINFIKRILVVAIIGTFIWGIRWATFARPPLQEALDALESDHLVAVKQDPWLTFSPASHTPTAAFIFYPGGRVDPQGYAPLMHAIAAEGYLVVVPEMPINMAVFNPNIADQIIAHYPNIQHWVIGGHSVGGTMAAQFTDSHRGIIDGLVIWASYPADTADLSDFTSPVVSIYGSDDPGVNDQAITERKDLLPNATQYVRIEGGDHHQFGAYQINPDEGHAAVSRASQHEQIIQATLEFLSVVSNK